MIHIFLGTKAQLIKMAPIMLELDRRGIEYNFIFSGQHKSTVDEIITEFGLRCPDITLYEGRDVTGIVQMFFWSLFVLFKSCKDRKSVWRGDKAGVVLVHGDTFSTLLGAVLAKVAGHRCAHVESGLRSFRVFSPFPEELIRLATFKLTDIYFAPGEWAVSNLRKYRGAKINTEFNTLLDSLAEYKLKIESANISIPEKKYAVVSIHRFENIFSKEMFTKIIDLLINASERIPLVFILHKPTKKKLIEFGLLDRLRSSDRIELRDRYSYFNFMRLLQGAELVMTDGGSNQEECFYLGKPCIVLRSATERKEGMGENVVISNYENHKVLEFIDKYSSYARASFARECSPSKIIVDTLLQQG